MQKDPDMPSVSKMMMNAIMAPHDRIELNKEQQEAVMKEADRLPFTWISYAYKKTKDISLDCLVQVAQKGTVFWLNRLQDKIYEEKSVYGYRAYIERRLVRFLLYLQKNHKTHFDFNGPMPRQFRGHLKREILEAIQPGENFCLQEVDEDLVALLKEQCSDMIGKRVPSFSQGYYWKELTAELKRKLFITNATVRTVYTLVSCNFNSDVFVQYVISSYGKACKPDLDATAYWQFHQEYFGNIPKKLNMILDPEMPSSKEMLFTGINHVIQQFIYTKKTEKMVVPLNFRTAMTAAELALFYRLKVDTKMHHEDNDKELMRKLAQLYETPQGSPSPKYLQNMYYKMDRSTIENLGTRLSKMQNRLNELAKMLPKMK